MSKILVAYFSHTGENYSVGHIDVGNTHLVAEMLARALAADIAEIEPVHKYPEKYGACVKQARQEMLGRVRPELVQNIDISAYATVCLGYPVWCDDMPMAVYTFIEANNWQGKQVVPFVTHEGSSFGSTVSKLQQAVKGASVKPGLAIYGKVAQNSRAQAEQLVKQFAGNLLQQK